MVDEPEAYFKKVGKEERAFGRVIDWLALYNAMSNILGNKQKQLLADWRQIGNGHDLPLRRAERWNSDSSGAAPEPIRDKPRRPRFGHGNPPNHFFDTDKLKHQDRRVYSIIDLPTWDRANWGATLYMYGSDPRMPPGMVLGFGEPEAGKAIFSQWREQLGPTDTTERIRVAILTGIDKNNPAHYKIVIESNIPEDDWGEPGSQQFIILSRINRMTPADTRNLDAFMRNFNAAGFYYLMPGHFRGFNAEPEVFGEFAIKKHQIAARAIWKVDENDPDVVAVDLEDTPLIPPGIDDAPVLRAIRRKRRFQKG